MLAGGGKKEAYDEEVRLPSETHVPVVSGNERKKECAEVGDRKLLNRQEER